MVVTTPRLEVDYMEYSTDPLAYAAYKSNCGYFEYYFIDSVTDIASTNVTTSYSTETVTVAFTEGGGDTSSSSYGTWTPYFTGNVTVKCWGRGGNGDADSSVGGVGGGGGGYASKTSVAVVAGVACSIHVGDQRSGSTQINSDTVFTNAAATITGGRGTNGSSGGAGGTGSGGDVAYTGGAGGAANTTIDCSGGGGGGAGPAGDGVAGTNATSSAAGGGGAGNNGSGGAGGAAGVSGDKEGKNGTANSTGGGGGGGGYTSSTAGGAGGAAGGGGGGAESGAGKGGSGRLEIIIPTQYIYAMAEATIKTEGTYSLKVWADQTNSLNKYIIRTFTSPIGLDGVKNLSFDMYASRTGANVKFTLSKGALGTGGTGTIYHAEGRTYQIWTSSGTFVPEYSGDYLIEAWGSGGNGSSASNYACGGGGGAYAGSTKTLTAGTTYTITIGAGGGTTLTSFESDPIADHGVTAPSNTSPGAGGLVANSTGDTKYAGGTGGQENAVSLTCGGGGGAAGRNGAGANGTDASTTGGAGGTGDATYGGAGGAGGATTGTAGAAGGSPIPLYNLIGIISGGGGGGGGFNTSGGAGGYPGGGGGGGDTTYGTYGAGANGMVAISIAEPVLEITPNINAANTWQKVNFDLSSYDAYKLGSVDTLKITITNADADNTFYIDNFRIAQAIDVFGIC